MNKLTFLIFLILPLCLAAQQTGTLTDSRDGKTYQTVKIGDQWWMAENLNYGTRINGSQNQTDNSTAEKYCYSDSESNCDSYGGLYQWNELMNYTSVEMIQGICPAGWHVPSEDEWQELEIYLGMDPVDAASEGLRGTDQGTQLKQGGSSGFEALMAGKRNTDAVFENLSTFATFWTSSGTNRTLSSSWTQVYNGGTYDDVSNGFSLRCVTEVTEGEDSIAFYDINTSIASGSIPSIDLGDYNNDGILDVLYSGVISGTREVRIYQGNGSDFFNIGVGIVGLAGGAVHWGDYNNDNYPDIFVSGINNDFNYQSEIYQNNSGTSFTNINADIEPLSDGGADWGDYDNDGDLDLIITGRIQSAKIPVTALYRNEGSNTFTRVETDIIDVYESTVFWGDYDNDLDLDILISGRDNNGNLNTRIYRNDGNDIFTDIDAMLSPISDGMAKWGDFDNDNDLDVLVVGRYPGIMENLGNDNFTMYFTFPLLIFSSADWGDYDSDGDLDIIMHGRLQFGAYETFIYRNDSLYFNEVKHNIDNPSSGAVIWGDYDNDKDLDIIMATSGYSEVYRNELNNTNSAPSVPGGLHTEIIGRDAYMMWDHSTDAETPDNGISYNVIAGTYSGGMDLISPMSNTTTGKLYFQKIGNANHNNSWVLKNLDPGTYYWRVQAIDHTYNYSQFSSQVEFTVLEEFTGIDIGFNDYECYPSLADYDNDNDLDIFFYGKDDNWISSLYENQTGYNFSEVVTDIIDIRLGDVTWRDYDRDGDLDIFLIGGDNVEQYALIYRNENGSFDSLDIGITGLYHSSSDFGDFDNDGDVDIIISGYDSDNSITRIYRNDGDDEFSEYSSSIVNCNSSSVKWIDFDNDRDLDVFICGQHYDDGTNTSYFYSRIYENNNGQFSDIGATMHELAYGEADIGDFDNDADLDLLITGWDIYTNKYTFIYKNNGDGTFSKVDANYIGFRRSSARWCDYNNDGLLDILVSGEANYGNYFTILYINKDNEEFEEFILESGAAQDNKSQAGDIDNDGDLDIIVAGAYLDEFLRINNGNWPGPQPEAPDNLNFEQHEFDIILSWDKVTDLNNPFKTFSYNLRIGTSPGSDDIIATESDNISGYRRIPQLGNVQMNTSWRINNLSDGTYYWSVQAIDKNFVGGIWTPEESFTISKVSTNFDFDTACVANPTIFTDLSVVSEGVIDGWKWYFGDGDSASVRNPSHTYSQGGYYDVTLTAYSGEFKHSKTKTVYVKHKPYADFNTDVVCVGAKTTFTDFSDIDSVEVAYWVWDFGDGDISNIQGSAEHPYLQSGNYQTKLTIVAENGCIDTTLKAVVVGEYPNDAIGLDYGYPVFCEGDSAQLSVEHDENYIYQWKLNNFNLTGASASRLTVKNSGDYAVVITNPYGNCIVESNPVEISVSDAPPKVNITALTDTIICQGQTVEMNVPYNPDYSYQWRLDGIDIYQATSNIFFAEEEGQYSVVMGIANCKITTSTKKIEYKPGLPKPDIIVEGKTHLFLGCDITDALDYRWYFNSDLIPGADSYIYFAGTNYGEYYVEVNDGGECYVPSDKVTIPTVITGSQPSLHDDNITITPNPSNGEFYLNFVDGGLGEILIKITDLQGSVVYETKFTNDLEEYSREFRLEYLDKGFYLMKIQYEKQFIILKFLVI